VNRWVPVLRGRGIQAIVVLAHAGGPTQDESDAPDFVGEIVEEAREMSPAVDAVIAGHSHSRLDIRVPHADCSGDKADRGGALVRRRLRPGDLTIDTATGEVLAKTGRIPGTPHDVAGDGRMSRRLGSVVGQRIVDQAVESDEIVHGHRPLDHPLSG
jgi:hypothetical protein